MSARLLLGKFALLASLTLFTACPGQPPAEAPEIVLGDLALGDTTVGATFEKTISVSGGTAPITFTASGLPDGITVNGSNGTLSGKATAAGDFNVTLTAKDDAGKQASKSAPLKVYAGLSFATTSLPRATEGAPYSATVELKGGKAPVTVSVAGGELPPGITWDDAQSALVGTPAASRSFTFTLKAIEAHAIEAVRAFTISVAAPLTLSPDALPVGNVGKPYTAQLSSTGGNAPITFSVASGALPPGLSLNGTTGAISGSPTASGNVSFTLAASDTAGAVASKTYSVSIFANAPPNIVTTALANGTVSVAYSQNLAATDGAPPYSWTITSGSLPAGLSLSTTGTVSGVPTSEVSANLQVEVTDANGQKDVGAISLSVYSKLAITTASLPESYVGTAFSDTLTATGGVPPYTWSTNAASLPAGLSLTNGILAGTPAQAGSFAPVFTVTDGSGQTVNKSLVLTVYALPTLTTASLPNGAVNVPYSQQLAATGGKAPYTYSIVGGALPAGLVLGGNLISGTPTGPASANVTLQVSDSNGRTDAKTFALNVFAALAVTSGNPPDGYVGQPYNEALTAAGGQAPYTWSVISGVLPAGLTLSGSSISGSPTAAANATFTVQVQDAAGTTATRALVLGVYKLPTISSTSVPDGYVADAYSGAIAAIDGKQPLTFSVTSGALPAGLALSSGGAISGTPTATASSNFTVQVQDANGKQASRSFSLAVYTLPAVTAPTFPDFYATEAISQQLSATGGKAPLTWTTTGAMPTGVTLSSTGALSGTPGSTAVGTFTPNAIATDANGKTAQAQLTLRVYALPTLVAGSIPDAYTGEPYSQTVGSSGGKGPNTFTVSAGALPAGFTLSATTGVISGSPTTAASAQSFTVKITDQNGRFATQSYSMGVYAPPAVTTASFVDGYVTSPYSQPVNATGGKAPITWSITTGSLPAGLSVGSTAVTGTPTAAGTSTFQLTATDANGRAAQQTYSLAVYTPPTITTTSLADGYVGESYSKTLTATGGKGTLTFAMASGALPAGLALSSTGAITGTPAIAAASTTFTIRVTDANGTASTASLTMAVYESLNLTTTALADGYVTKTYSQALTSSGGKSPITWTASGLPSGLSLSGASITGTPSATGNSTVQLTATDANGRTAAKSLALAVYTLPTITTTSLADGYTGEAYNQTLTATGGKGTLTFAIATGALPAGLSLSTAGAITGTPTTAAASTSFTVRVTDANGTASTASLTMAVYQALSITTATLADGYLTTAYSQTVASNGGKSPINWSASGLPGGLSFGATGITGTPTAAGTSTVQLTGTDANGRTAQKSLALVVYTLPSITSTSFPDTSIGATYSATAAATGGKTSYTWSISAGALPTGLTLTATTGQIGGAATATGTFTFTLKVTDANGMVATKAFTVTVRQMSITTASPLTDGYATQPYSVTFAATDGVAPLTWSVSSGTLPAGLTLSSSGVLGTTLGAVSNGQVHNFTIRVTDSAGQVATKAFSMTTWTMPTLTNTTLTTATEGVTYMKAPGTNEAFAATGGKTPLTITATGLSSGLTLQSSGAIVGIPAQGSAGTYTVSATVTDANNKSTNKSYTLSVVVPRPMAGGGGTVSVAPQGSPITDVLTVFVASYDGTGKQGAGVRVRKNGVEYATPKQGVTDASGKVVFTGMGLNGTTDTVDITASGPQLINVTWARVNASVVTLPASTYVIPGRMSDTPAALVNGKLFAPMAQKASSSSANLFMRATRCASTVQRLDSVTPTPTWTEARAPAMPNAPSPRTGYAITSLGQYIFLFGGKECGTNAILGDAYQYDTSTNTWMPLPPGPQPRTGATLVTDGQGALYLFGGTGGNNLFFPEVWRLDQFGGWVQLPASSNGPAVSDAAVGVLPPTIGNSVLVCGGQSASGPQSACSSFDLMTRTWSPMPPLPEPRYGMPMSYDPMQNQFVIFGGRKVDAAGMLTVSNDMLVRSAAQGAAWMPVQTFGGIEPRMGHVLYFDPGANSLVAIGGRANASVISAAYDDLWTLSGNQWIRRTPVPTVATTYTLSGVITVPAGLAPNGGWVHIRAETAAGGNFYGVYAWIDPTATNGTPYTFSGLPAGEALAVSALFTDDTATFPNDLKDFVDLGEIGTLTSDRTLNINFPAPLALSQSTGTMAFPSTWGNTSVYVTPYGARPGYVGMGNGEGSYDATSRSIVAAYYRVATGEDLELDVTDATACEGAYWIMRSVPTGSLGTISTPAMPSGFSPGVAECGGMTNLPTVAEGSYSVTAPSGADFLYLRRGPNRQATDWVYIGPVVSGVNTVSLPAVCTLVPSRGSPSGQEVSWSAYVDTARGGFNMSNFSWRTLEVDKEVFGGARVYTRQ